MLGLAGLAAVVASGCNRRPSAEIQRECETARRWVDLDKSDVTRCLQDAAFRDQLRLQVDERFAADLALTHNRDRGLLKLQGAPSSSFTRLAKPSALPVKTLGMETKDEKHIGERYVVRAKVEWSPSDEPGFAPHIFLSPPENEKEGEMVGTDALNQYQRRFLSNHCWLGGPPPTLCEGDVYVEIRKDADGSFVGAQVVAADFGEGDAKALLAYFARSHPAPRSPSR